MARTLSTVEAKRFYDHFGSKQDSQAFYEDRALSRLIENAAFEQAGHLFEFGCGTGRFAERLLQSVLTADCRYMAVDLSTTMAALAQARLRGFGPRVVIEQGDMSALGALPFSPDRIVSTYVVDLMPEPAIADFIAKSWRALSGGGRLCLVSLTIGTTLASSVVSGGWNLLFRLSPRLVGGCRPVRLTPYLGTGEWRLLHQSVVTSYGVPSEVIVAEKVSA